MEKIDNPIFTIVKKAMLWDGFLDTGLSITMRSAETC